MFARGIGALSMEASSWIFWIGGANRDRTDDLKLAKLALSQLSYGPMGLLLGHCEGWLAGPKLRGNQPAFALRASARQPSLRFA
jgi:hypothetical protein